ncbi:MAG TPA: hypothetical protein DDX40_02230 [Rikenellaceae bacterium]|nr:hypothetical protein [Rikenellaceae bacterium]
MKKALKIFWGFIVALAALLFACWILLQTPAVQTFAARKAVEALGDVLNGRIEFSKVHLKPFTALVLKDVTILDNEPVIDWNGERVDTVARAGSIVTTFSVKGLRNDGTLHIKRLSVSDGLFVLAKDDRGGNIGRLFKKPAEKKEKKPLSIRIDAGRVQIKNFRFRLVNTTNTSPLKEYGIDWKNLDVTAHELQARDVSFSGGRVDGNVVELRAGERSGYNILSMSGKTTVEKGRTLIRGLRILDDWSDIHMSEYSMEYDSIRSFSNYLDEVSMVGKIFDSKVDFKSISYFAPSLRKMHSVVYAKKLDVVGPVSDLRIGDFRFSEAYSGVAGLVDGRLTGLPDVGGMTMDFNISDLGFTSDGLGTFVKGFAPAARIDLSKFASGVRLTFGGKAKGTLNKLKVKGEVTSPLGSLTADANIRNLIKKGAAMGFGGSLSARNLDIGRLASLKQIGEVTMRGAMDLSLGKGQTNLRIDSLFVDKLSALGYSYSNIVAAGTYSDNAFDGRIVCSDPNLNFLFQGLFTLSDKTRNGLYKFYASIGYADLHALNLDKREISRISGRVNANYINISRGDLIGDLDILGLTLENDNGRHEIGDICMKSHSNNNVNRVNLTSGFMNGNYIGTKPFTSLVKDALELTVQRDLPVLFGGKAKEWKSNEYDLRIDVGDARDFLSFIKPGLYISQGTKVRFNVARDGNVTASVRSPRMAVNRNFLKDINLSFDNRDSSLNASVICSAISVSGLNLQNDSFLLYAKDNGFGVGFTYDNGTEPANKGEIYLTGKFGRSHGGDLTVEAKTLPSFIWYEGAAWNISESAIALTGEDVRIDNLTAKCADQSIRINGGCSPVKEDTLSVNLVKFDIGLLNKFLGDSFGISGLATGNAVVTSPWKSDAGMALSLTSDSTEVAGRRMGTLRLAGSLDNNKMRVVARNDIDGRRTLNIAGDYHLKGHRIDATAGFDGMDVGYIAPVLKSVFSEVGGSLSGNVKVKGTPDSLSLSSEGTRFDDVLLKVGFTNVPYHVSGPFSVTDQGMFFDGIKIKDRFDGAGTISGGLLYNHLKDLRMDAKINVKGIEAIDMTENDNQAFYGHLSATGDIMVTGPFEAILLDVNVRTDKDGRILIPIDNASNDGKNDLLTFKEVFQEIQTDPYEAMMSGLSSGKGKGSDFGIRLRVNVNQGTEANVEIDRTAGNTLSARGQGTLDIEVRPARDLFTINGDYTLRSGNFHFNAMDIAKRDFSISEGSSVRFNGDVMDSDLDIKGVYTTKASVATLIADTTSISARRVVNCGIGVSGKLREPKLSFSIEVPDLDPTTKSRVESALNTEDKVQRQFLSLLISGSFMPEEQSGVVNNTNMLYSNVAEIMAGQLNNILQKLDIPLDLGLNYQSSDSGTNIFDVAVSTQLFNNRVIVNGNVGNREYSNSSSSEGDVVGNLDIEIKLDKSGQLRLNLFSHSADDYTAYLDNTQRNGVGIAYQREFNTFREFLRNLFTSKKKREQRAAAYENVQREVRRIVINEGSESEESGKSKKK